MLFAPASVCHYFIVFASLLVFTLGEDLHVGLNSSSPEYHRGYGEVEYADAPKGLHSHQPFHTEDQKYHLTSLKQEDGKNVVKNGVLTSKGTNGGAVYFSGHSKSWLRGGDPTKPEAYTRNRHSILLEPQENRQAILERKVQKIRPLQAGVMQVHIAPLHRRAPVKKDPRPKWEWPADELEHEMEMRYDELAVEFRVTDKAGIDVIQLYLPERQDCRGSGKNLICSGYEFMTEPKKEFSAAQGEGPGFGGCVFRRHNAAAFNRDDMTLPSDSKVKAEEIDFDKDILSCMVNNRIGDGEPDMPRRSGLEIVFKKTFVPKDQSGENLFRYFIIMIQNPNQSPVWPRLDAHGTDANSFIFQWGKRAHGYKSEVIAFPAQDIKPIWECSYTQWIQNKECTAKCGGGMMFTTRRIHHLPPRKDDPRYDPLLLSKCDEPLEKRDPCNTFLCDVHCRLGEWVADAGCSAPCGGGYQVYRRHIIQPPRGLGKACPAWNDPRRVKYVPCSKPETQQLCEDTCEARDEEFTYTGPCSEYCGVKGGVRYKFRQVPRKQLDRKDFGETDEVEVIKEYAITHVSGIAHKEPVWIAGVVKAVNPHAGLYTVETPGDGETNEYRKYELREAPPNGVCLDRDADQCESDGQCKKSIYDDKVCLGELADGKDGGLNSKDGCDTSFIVETCGTMKACLDFEIHSAQGNVMPLADMWHEVAVVWKLNNYAKIVEIRAPEGYSFGPVVDPPAPCVLRYPEVKPNGKPRDLTFPTSFTCVVSGHKGRHAVLKFKNALEPTPDPPSHQLWEPKYEIEIWVRHPPCHAAKPPQSLCDLDKNSRRWSLGIWTEFPGVWEEHEFDGYQLHASAKFDHWDPSEEEEEEQSKKGKKSDSDSSFISRKVAGKQKLPRPSR